MVSTRSMVNKRMLEVEQMALLMSLQREMIEMKKKNEEEILSLRKENEEMKRKLVTDRAILQGSPLRMPPTLRLSRSQSPLIPRRLRASPT